MILGPANLKMMIKPGPERNDGECDGAVKVGGEGPDERRRHVKFSVDVVAHADGADSREGDRSSFAGE
jgi:hypothetical protein